MKIRKICGDLFELSIDATPRPREWREMDGEAVGINRKKAGIVRFLWRGDKVMVLKGNVMLTAAEITGMMKTGAATCPHLKSS